MNDKANPDYIQTTKDIYWTFVLPLICSYSIITSVINLVVFASLKSKNIIYKFMLYNSMSDIAYLVSVMFVFVMRCGQFCDELKDSYMAKFYQHYIFNFVASSFGLFGILIEILISMQIIFFLTNREFIWRFTINLTLIGFLIFSFVFCLPLMYAFEIKSLKVAAKGLNATRVIYVREYVSQNMSFLFRNLVRIQVSFRLVLIVCLIFTLNYLTYYLFKKQTRKKLKMKTIKLDSSKLLTKKNVVPFKIYQGVIHSPTVHHILHGSSCDFSFYNLELNGIVRDKIRKNQ